MARRLIPALSLVVLIALVAAHAAGATSAQRAASPSLHTVTIGMGYIPNVQFAPFYVADQRGYYRQAGLKVDFNYASSPDLLELVGAGRMGLAIADGTDAIAAVAHGVPIVYVMAEYQRFPVAIFSLAGSHIRSVAGLRGKTIGVPGRYGATYVGLLAALHAAALHPSDVKIQAIKYTQVESVAAGKVDAAVGYSPNEPVLLARRGYKVNVIEVSDVANLVGPGVVAGHGLMAHNPALVRAFIQATLRGMADAIANPRMAFTMALRVHGLTTLHGRDAADQYAVLLRTIAFWHSPATRAHGLGYADPTQWRTSVRILHAIGQLPHMPEPATLYTNTFVAGSARR
jgi:NitT/TauT family transport system substrate-binding protein